jgi:hypothetical protein
MDETRLDRMESSISELRSGLDDVRGEVGAKLRR